MITLVQRHPLMEEEKKEVDEIIQIPIFERLHYRILSSDGPIGFAKIKLIPQENYGEDGFLVDFSMKLGFSLSGKRYSPSVKGYLVCELGGTPSIFNFTLNEQAFRLTVLGKFEAEKLLIFIKGAGLREKKLVIPFDPVIARALSGYLKHKEGVTHLEELIRPISERIRIEKVDEAPFEEGSLKFISLDGFKKETDWFRDWVTGKLNGGVHDSD